MVVEGDSGEERGRWSREVVATLVGPGLAWSR